MSVLERQPATLGEIGRHRLGAVRDDAREHAGGADRDREVRDPADADVQGGIRVAGAVQRADHRERREVDPVRPKAGPARRLEQLVDHVAARGDDDDPRPRALGRLDDPQRVVLEHRLLERHRDVLLGLEADRRGDLLRVGQRRKVERAHDDPLVGDAEPYPPAELVLREQLAQHGGERVDVDDLAVAHDAGR